MAFKVGRSRNPRSAHRRPHRTRACRWVPARERRPDNCFRCWSRRARCGPANSTAFCGVSDQAPINFCPLYSHSSAGMMLTLLTADSAIRSSAYLRNAAAGSNWVCAIVTVAHIPCGPSSRPPTSPDPAVIDQPSGTPTVILGARGSSTSAVIRTAGLTGCEQATVFGGTGARVVGTTPGADSSASWVGRVVADGADDVAVAASSPATGTPSLVRTHAASTQASASAAHPARFISPSRKRARIPVPDPRTACPRHLRSPDAMVPPVNANGAL